MKYSLETDDGFEIEVEVDIDYYFRPAVLHLAPENCSPAEEEGEVTPSKGAEDVIRDYYSRAAEAAIAKLRKELDDLDMATIRQMYEEEYR